MGARTICVCGVTVVLLLMGCGDSSSSSVDASASDSTTDGGVTDSGTDGVTADTSGKPCGTGTILGCDGAGGVQCCPPGAPCRAPDPYCIRDGKCIPMACSALDAGADGADGG